MNREETAATWLATIAGWENRPFNLVPMGGGYSHRCYRVDSAGYRYLLRIPRAAHTPDAEKFAIECKLQQLAAGEGLAPPILHADPERGLMLTECLPGPSWTAENLQDRSNLDVLADLLRQLHRLPRCGTAFDAHAAAVVYRSGLPATLANSREARLCQRVIESTPLPSALCLCHNDVVAENLVMGNTLKLVDFEFACDNDPLFDLASIIGWHDLPHADSEYLLTAYGGGASAELQERLQSQLRLYDALQWLWLAYRQQQHPDEDLRRRLQRVAARLR